jgi:hypothetical protein
VFFLAWFPFKILRWRQHVPPKRRLTSNILVNGIVSLKEKLLILNCSLSLVSTTEGILGRKSSDSGVEIREYGRKDPSR